MRAPQELLNHRNDLQHSQRLLRTEVKRFPPDLLFPKTFCDTHIRSHDVLNKNIITNIGPITPHDRSFAMQEPADRSWHDPAPVQVAAPIDIATSNDSKGEVVGMMVG